MIRKFLLALAIFVAVPAAAQNGTEPRLWTAVTLQGRESNDSPWQWSADSLVRTRAPAPWTSLGSGDSDTRSHAANWPGRLRLRPFPDNGTIREHRIVQQFTWSTGIGGERRSRAGSKSARGEGRAGCMRQQIRVTRRSRREGCAASSRKGARQGQCHCAGGPWPRQPAVRGCRAHRVAATRIGGYLNLTAGRPNGKRRTM
jgi:hypothetical protein